MQIFIYLEHELEKETGHIVIMIFQLQIMYKNQLESKKRWEPRGDLYTIGGEQPMGHDRRDIYSLKYALKKKYGIIWELFLDTQNTFYFMVKGLKNAYLMHFSWVPSLFHCCVCYYLQCFFSYLFFAKLLNNWITRTCKVSPRPQGQPPPKGKFTYH